MSYRKLILMAFFFAVFLPTVVFASDLQHPHAIVLNTGDNPSHSVTISWRTSTYSEKNTLELSTSPFLTDAVTYDAFSYSVFTHLFGQPHSFGSHYARLNDLTPNTQYFYRINNGPADTGTYSFKTLPSQGSFKLAVFGDVQGYNQAQYNTFASTFDMAERVSGTFDMALLAGDVMDSSDQFEEWQFLSNAMERVNPRMIWSAAIGNHDVKDRGFVFESTFIGPQNGVTGLENRNYWFEVGNAFIFVWDTERPSTFQAQGQHLMEVSAASDKTHRIVLMHRSAYPMSYNESHIRKLAPYFEEAKIDLVISGHDHIYSRTSMFENQKTNRSDGVVYVCTGSSSGSKFYTELDGNRYWRDVVYDHDNPVFCVLSMDEESLEFKAYAIEQGVATEIDSFQK